MEITNLHLRQYLLGNLDEPTETEIGLQIMTDASLEDKLLIAQNDLMEDFLDENLTSAEKTLFYDNFLVSTEREKQLEEIAFFRRIAEKPLPVEVSGGQITEDRESFWSKLKRLSSFKLQFAVSVLAIFTIAAIAGFYIFNQNKPSPLETEYAALNRQDFSDPNAFPRISKVGLISGTFRSSGDTEKIKSAELSGEILFRLALPFAMPDGETVNAGLIKDQKIVFRQSDIRVYKNQNGQEIRLLLPKTILSKGQYRIEIENPKAENSAVSYDFAVE